MKAAGFQKVLLLWYLLTTDSYREHEATIVIPVQSLRTGFVQHWSVW